MQKTRRNSRITGRSARQVTFCGWRHVRGLLLSPSFLFATDGDDTVRSLLSVGIPYQRGPYDIEDTRAASERAGTRPIRHKTSCARGGPQIWQGPRRAHGPKKEVPQKCKKPPVTRRFLLVVPAGIEPATFRV